MPATKPTQLCLDATRGQALVLAARAGATHYAEHHVNHELFSISFFAGDHPSFPECLCEVAYWSRWMERFQATGRPFAKVFLGQQYTFLCELPSWALEEAAEQGAVQ